MESKVCPGCGKTPPHNYNYCNWECHIKAAKEAGGKVFCPNGLPIRSMDRNGNMFEIEGGDHPNYKFPVTVEYIGPYDQKEDHDIIAMLWKISEEKVTEEIYRQYKSERHALIYTDGCVAITMYECNYAMFFLKDGMMSTGSLWRNWDKGKPIMEYKLSEESRIKIIEFAKKQEKHVNTWINFFKEQVEEMKSMSCAAKDLPKGWTMVRTEDLDKLGIFTGDDDE